MRTARTQGQLQIATFFQGNGAPPVLDPDGPLPVCEVPVTDPNVLETTKFSNPPPTPSPACASTP